MQQSIIEKTKKRQQEIMNNKMKNLKKMKDFFRLGVFWDLDKNPKMQKFRENALKKKELECFVLERKNYLEKVKEKYEITKNIYETTIRAFIEDKNENKFKKESDYKENQSKIEIKEDLNKEDKILNNKGANSIKRII